MCESEYTISIPFIWKKCTYGITESSIQEFVGV